MKYRWDKKYLYWGVTALLVMCASICFFYLVFHSSSVTSGFQRIVRISMPIINGLAMAYLFTPIVNWSENTLLLPIYRKIHPTMNKKEKSRMRGFAILITVFIVFFILYGFFSMIIPEILKSVQSIILQFPIYINNLIEWSSELLSDNPEFETLVTDLLGKYSSELDIWLNQTLLPQLNEIIKSLSLSVIGFLKSLWNLIIGFILSIYLLAGKEKLVGQSKKIAYALFEVKTANQLIDDVRFTHRTFSGFLIGKIVDSIIIGIICFFCTNMIGTPYAVLVSVIIGLTNIIPFFGPYLGAIPSALLILMIDPKQCLYFVIFIIILQQFDGNFLGPKILGNKTGLTSFWVIFSITIFGGLFGILGMFIGVPTFAVIYAGFRGLFNNMLKKKGLLTETDTYEKLEHIKNNQYITLSNDHFSKKEVVITKEDDLDSLNDITLDNLPDDKKSK